MLLGFLYLGQRLGQRVEVLVDLFPVVAAEADSERRCLGLGLQWDSSVRLGWAQQPTGPRRDPIPCHLYSLISALARKHHDPASAPNPPAGTVQARVREA